MRQKRANSTGKVRYIKAHMRMEKVAVQNLIATINAIPEEDQIHIDFETDGGSVMAAAMLGETIFKRRQNITIYNTGRVDSSGIIPFLAAGTRVAASKATFLYHPIRVGVPVPPDADILWVSKEVFQQGIDQIEQDERNYANLHERQTAVPRGMVRQLLSSDNVQDAQWAVNMRVVHRIDDFLPPAGCFVCVVPSRSI